MSHKKSVNQQLSLNFNKELLWQVVNQQEIIERENFYLLFLGLGFKCISNYQSHFNYLTQFNKYFEDLKQLDIKPSSLRIINKDVNSVEYFWQHYDFIRSKQYLFEFISLFIEESVPIPKVIQLILYYCRLVYMNDSENIPTCHQVNMKDLKNHLLNNQQFDSFILHSKGVFSKYAYSKIYGYQHSMESKIQKQETPNRTMKSI